MTGMKKNYHADFCSRNLLGWFTLTFLNFFLIQILLVIAHNFTSTTFWIWLFMCLYIPLTLIYNIIGNVWISEID